MSPIYQYHVKDIKGETIKGVLRGENLKEAASRLREEGYFIIRIKDYRGINISRMSFLNLSKSYFSKKAGPQELMVFCRQFFTFLRAGITVTNALRVITRQMEHKAFQSKLENVIASVEQGNTLADSFRDHRDFFPEIFINMVETGELGGILDKVMERLAIHFEKEYDLREKIKSAVAYPAVVSVIALLVIVFLMVVIIPTFAEIFGVMGIEPPFLTRLILNAGQISGRFWYLMPLIILIAINGIKAYFKTEKGRYFYDSIRLRVPVIGRLYQKILISTFCRNLSNMINSGVSLLVALEQVQNVLENVVYGQAIDSIMEDVKEGNSMGDSMVQTGVFPLLVVEMVTTGEEAGTLDSMLEKTSVFYEEELAYHVNRLGKTLEPVLIIFLAVVVGIIAVSVIVPMFNIFGQIGKI